MLNKTYCNFRGIARVGLCKHVCVPSNNGGNMNRVGTLAEETFQEPQRPCTVQLRHVHFLMHCSAAPLLLANIARLPPEESRVSHVGYLRLRCTGSLPGSAAVKQPHRRHTLEWCLDNGDDRSAWRDALTKRTRSDWMLSPFRSLVHHSGGASAAVCRLHDGIWRCSPS